MTWGAIAAAGINAGVGLMGQNQIGQDLDRARGDVNSLAEFNPLNASGPGGSTQFGNGGANFQLGPQQQAMQAMMTQQGGGLLGGGMFNDPRFQQAFQQNDIAGALGQANNAFGQQAQGSAFGGLGGLFNQAQGLGGQFVGQTAQGPQDFTGGLQAGLFNQGAMNQQAAGNQQGLFNQSLNTQRAAASGGLLDQAINKFQNRQFAQGRMGSTGGAQEQGQFLNSLAQQDLGFQNNAFGQAQQQQQFLGQLGGQQIGQGSQLLGQNLGQFNQNAANAQGFLGLGGRLEGQGFGQNLGALQQNQQAGMQRLQAAQGLFGLGSDVFSQNFGLGLGAQQGLMDQNRFGLENILGLGGMETDRIGATGGHAASLANLGTAQAESSGGFFSGLGGIGDAIGGLFD